MMPRCCPTWYYSLIEELRNRGRMTIYDESVTLGKGNTAKLWKISRRKMLLLATEVKEGHQSTSWRVGAFELVSEQLVHYGHMATGWKVLQLELDRMYKFSYNNKDQNTRGLKKMEVFFLLWVVRAGMCGNSTHPPSSCHAILSTELPSHGTDSLLQCPPPYLPSRKQEVRRRHGGSTSPNYWSGSCIYHFLLQALIRT